MDNHRDAPERVLTPYGAAGADAGPACCGEHAGDNGLVASAGQFVPAAGAAGAARGAADAVKACRLLAGKDDAWGRATVLNYRRQPLLLLLLLLRLAPTLVCGRRNGRLIV